MKFRNAAEANDASDERLRISRRVLFGAGAAAAAGMTVGLAGPAFADARPVAGPGRFGGEVPFGPVVVAGQGQSTSYARAVRLSTVRPGRTHPILATYQDFGNSGFPIYRSDDDGRTWTQQSTVGSGVALQPFLYELPRPFAGLPQGALLFACNSFGNFTSTNIQLYASTDQGVTWTFLSTVAQGGPPNTTNGATPVWEPFLLLHDGRLICYYSDQRDPNYGQKLAHQTSTDLHTWGPVVNDATGTAYPDRPGMTTVSPLPRGLWIMTYEFGTPDDPTIANPSYTGYPVHYRIARDPESFRFSKDTPLVARNGDVPNSSPVVTWSDFGGPNGTIVVTDNDHQNFFINRELGNSNAWTEFSSPMPAGYSRFTIPFNGPGDPRGLVFVITGAQYGDAGPVEAGIISLAS